MKNWDDYYAQTSTVPSEDRVVYFLESLPQNALILDLGCGTGRWAVAMHNARPDVTIDLVDQNIDHACLIPAQWNGEKIGMDFGDFVPAKTYDGIWAHHSLFLLPPEKVEPTFCKLANSLSPRGIFQFTMVMATNTARQFGFSGMAKEAIDAMISRASLEITFGDIGLEQTGGYFDNSAEYGGKSGRGIIPTFYLRAQKLTAG